jgi:hypothetical protein
MSTKRERVEEKLRMYESKNLSKNQAVFVGEGGVRA